MTASGTHRRRPKRLVWVGRRLSNAQAVEFKPLGWPDRVGGKCLSRSQRPRLANGAIPRRLPFHLGVQFSTKEDDDYRDPDPGHKANASSERAINTVIAIEGYDIPRECGRGAYPSNRRNGTTPTDPSPLCLTAAWAVSINKRKAEANEEDQSWPTHDPDHCVRSCTKADLVQQNGNAHHDADSGHCDDGSGRREQEGGRVDTH